MAGLAAALGVTAVPVGLGHASPAAIVGEALFSVPLGIVVYLWLTGRIR
jgi:hypothetical protein